MSASPPKTKVTQGGASDTEGGHATPASPPPLFKGGGGGDAVRRSGKSKVTRTKPPVPKASSADQTPVNLIQGTDETQRDAIARAMIRPSLRHGQLAAELGQIMVSQLPEEQWPGVAEYRKEACKIIVAAESGDIGIASQLLAAQAMTLDAIFTELARRSAINLGQHLDASERYMRLALKAQGNCRATLDALAKLHQPREQTVRHVHVNEGGQAIVADEFHSHSGGQGNGKVAEQPHAARAGAAGTGTALPGPDALRDGVSIAGREGESAMQDARGHVAGRP